MTTSANRTRAAVVNVDASNLDRTERLERTLISITIVLFLTQSAIFNVADVLSAAMSFDASQLITTLVVYAPFTLAVLSRFIRTRNVPIGSFLILYSLLAFGFILTLFFHPEYAPLMFSSEWPHSILGYVFSPLSAIFIFVILRVAEDPSLILRSLVMYAYVNFLYGLVRFGNFLITGSWTGYSFTGESVSLSYSLGFGYDMLAVFTALLMLAMMRRRPILNLLLAIASIVMIALAGSRAPLLFAVVGAAVLILYFGLKETRKSPIAAVGLILIFVLLTFVTLGFNMILDFVIRILNATGINSRSVEALATGEFNDDNGREKIWDMAEGLVQTGGLAGHGFYGDRYAISGRFFWGYPHNFFYEVIITFGPVLGAILIVSLVTIVILGFKRAVREEYRSLLIFFLVMSLQLSISSSYLLSNWFWALLAVAYLSLRAARRRKSVAPRGLESMSSFGA